MSANVHSKATSGSGAETVSILGTAVSRLTLEQLLDRIDEVAKSGPKKIFDYANIHALNTAYENAWLKDFYNSCDSVFCDGVGVQLAAKFIGSPIPERFTPPDWIDRLAEQCVQSKRSVFFLGSREGVAERVAEKLKALHPGLRVVGTHHGFFDKELKSEANLLVHTLINQASPDVLIVGFGTPLQERWLLENYQLVQAHVFLAVGAMFDYLAGNVSRGPRWMTDRGLEWLSRLVIEPRRLWKRYLIGIPVFFVRVLKQRLSLISMRS